MIENVNVPVADFVSQRVDFRKLAVNDFYIFKALYVVDIFFFVLKKKKNFNSP